MQTLKDKTVLITGAGGGIGSQTAQLLVQSGARVYLSSKSEEKLSATAQACKLSSERLFPCDLSIGSQVSEMCSGIIREAGVPDILINASGIGIIKPFEQLTEEDFQRSLEINLLGAYRLIHGFLPGMKERKTGLIINIPGVLGKTPMAGAAAYAASKYGLNGMMKSLREELKRTEIRITQVFLGGVDSPFWDQIDLRVQRDKMIVAQEAAKAIWFLCQQPDSAVVSEMVIQPFNHQAI